MGSVAIVWLSTEAGDQSSLHCVIVSTDVVSDHIGRRDASSEGGCSKTSAYTLHRPIWPVPGYVNLGWLGSRVVSVLDSGAVGPGFKW